VFELDALHAFEHLLPFAPVSQAHPEAAHVARSGALYAHRWSQEESGALDGSVVYAETCGTWAIVATRGDRQKRTGRARKANRRAYPWLVPNLHLAPPMTLGRITDVQRWVLPLAAVVFGVLGIGAITGTLVWDPPITNWVVDSRSPAIDDVFRNLSFFGSTKVVVLISAIAVLLAARRCPRLALAIIAIALARPATEFLLKELVSRDRPLGHRLVGGEGYSFPSGHPLATAASWGTLPLVAALYTKRRVLWWAIAIGVWTMVVLVAVSRVWLGVHWASDVIASIALAVIAVAIAERFVVRPDCRCSPDSRDGAKADHVSAEAVDRPILETTG
jgi:undecaprenyl-diphosphatase